MALAQLESTCRLKKYRTHLKHSYNAPYKLLKIPFDFSNPMEKSQEHSTGQDRIQLAWMPAGTGEKLDRKQPLVWVGNSIAKGLQNASFRRSLYSGPKGDRWDRSTVVKPKNDEKKAKKNDQPEDNATATDGSEGLSDALTFPLKPFPFLMEPGGRDDSAGQID